MARIRHVFNNPYHIWAHQSYAVHGPSENHGRNSSGNRSFQGHLAYSYRAAIAGIHYNQAGERLYLVSSETWSVTTSKHQGEVRSAIPAEFRGRVIEVDRIDPQSDYAHRNNVEELWYNLKEAQLKQKRARTGYMRTHWAERTVELMRHIRLYIEFFGLTGEMYQVPSSDEVIDAAAKCAELAEIHQRELREEEARQEERARVARLEAQEAIERWCAGENVRLPWLNVAFMRIQGDEIVTTQGATVPLDHVKRVAPLIVRAVKAGKAFYPDRDIRLGHYTLSRIEEDGTTVVGCHRFEKAEILRVAALIA